MYGVFIKMYADNTVALNGSTCVMEMGRLVATPSWV
jgi:hypothetical protein